MGIKSKALTISILWLSLAGCYGTDRARSAQMEAARVIHASAQPGATFDPCYTTVRVCRLGESPTDNTVDFCTEALCRGGNIRRLSLPSMQLTELSPEIGELTHLQYLYLDRNQLTTLPPEIGELTNLRGLDLSNNQLTSLPPEIGLLKNLEWLNMEGNQLTSLPPELGELEHLESLNLRGNPLSGPIPSLLTSLPLESFTFEETDLCVPPDEQMHTWLAGIEHVQTLSVRVICSLAPKEQAALDSLYEIAHPEGWSPGTSPCTWTGVGCNVMGRVTSLILNHADLNALPSNIGQLTYLERLDLSYNQLSTLPPEIGHLTSLKSLYLIENRLTSLPPEVGRLTNVDDLIVASNQLTELPAELGQLTQLKRLDISDNPLSGPLPAFLTNLPPESLAFIFEQTDLCIPDDQALLDWIRRLRDIEVLGYQWMLDNRSCPMSSQP